MWQSIPHLLRRRAQERPDHALLRCADDALTYAQTEVLTDAVAAKLLHLGIQRGENIAIALPNGIEFPVVWIALAKIGAVMVPLNLKHRSHDIAHVLRDAGAVHVICGLDQHDWLSGMDGLPQLRVVQVAELLEVTIQPAPLDIDALQPTDLLNIQFTSGTTGFPKGCMLTHEFWLLTAQAEADGAHCTADDIVLTTQPFYYMDSQWQTVMCLLCGCTLVILPGFSPGQFWNAVREARATYFYLIGTMPLFLLKQPVNETLDRAHSLRVAYCSGIPPERHAEMEARWGVPWRETYGSTESGADFVADLDDTDSVGTGALGAIIAGKEARAVDANGNDVADGDAGELILRGVPMMRGYWNNPEATAQKIRNGWLHSGDLVVRDARGQLRIVGRLKDMIRRAGENIAAAEVEAVLHAHAAVAAAAVIAVPDELRGEELKAFIQRNSGATLDAVDIIQFVRERLAEFKVPRYVEFVDALPRTPSERIAKSELAALSKQGATYDRTVDCWV